MTIAPPSLSGHAPGAWAPHQNWGKFEAHKWGVFNARSHLRAIDRKVLVREQGTHLLLGKKLGQKLARHLGLKQPVTVLREHGRHQLVPA